MYCKCFLLWYCSGHKNKTECFLLSRSMPETLGTAICEESAKCFTDIVADTFGNQIVYISFSLTLCTICSKYYIVWNKSMVSLKLFSRGSNPMYLRHCSSAATQFLQYLKSIIPCIMKYLNTHTHVILHNICHTGINLLHLYLMRTHTYELFFVTSLSIKVIIFSVILFLE